MEIQKTALYNYHKNLGAKFVPFAGYEMPIQYKEGIVKEHISTRTHAGFFDVSHMGQFFLEGDESLVEALEKIIPADLKNLKINHSKYSFLLNNEGGIIDDLIITRTEKGFCIILNAACKENDIKQISQFLTKNQVDQLGRIVDELDIPVLAFGIRTDFQGNLFEGSKYLLAWADNLKEIKTDGHCGRKATMVLRVDDEGSIVSDGSQIEIGGEERYVSVCRKHFKEKKIS